MTKPTVPFALSLSEAKLTRRVNGCTFFKRIASQKKDSASTSSARTGLGPTVKLGA